MRFRTRLLSLPFALSLAATGCQKEQAPSAEPAASIEKPSTIDPAIAKAVAAASAGIGKRAAAASSGGPPQSGVFAPGEADRQIKKGAPPILTLGSQGSEPRVKIGPMQPKPGWKSSGTVQIAVQSDARQGALPFELGVTLEAQKPKSAEAPAEGAPAPVTVVAKVTSARVGVTGVPAELVARVQKLKGSRVEYEIAPDGSGNNFRQELAPGAEETRDQLRVLSDMLALVTLPVPNQPLGQGAFWLTTSRDGVFGLDLVTYRMVKVEQANESGVTLSVNTKRYATSDRFDFQGLPPDAPRDLSDFESKSDGRLEFKIGAPFPESGEVQSLLAAGLSLGPAAGQQRAMLQIQSRVGLDFRPAAAPGK
jgi:hypothetical protein